MGTKFFCLFFLFQPFFALIISGAVAQITTDRSLPDRNLESIIKPVRATILDVDLRIIQECVDDKGEKALVVIKVPGMPEFPLEEKPSNYHDPNLPQFIEISKYISEADKEFYLDNLPGNTILRTEDGTPKFVNLCLRDLIEEQQNQ